MDELKFEDFTDARDLHDEVIKNFPENYKEIIGYRLNNLKADNNIILRKIKRQYLSHLSSLFMNDYLNNKYLFSEEEMNYIHSVRTSLGEFRKSIDDEADKEFLLRKGKLTPEQLDKYSTKLPKVDKDKIDGRPQIKPDYIERTKTFDARIVIGVVIGVLVTSVFVVTLGLFGLL